MEEDAEQRATDENMTRQNNIEADKEKAMEMRKRAMESMGETRERMGESDKGKRKVMECMPWRRLFRESNK